MFEAAIDGTSKSNIILFFWRRDDSDYASLLWIEVEEAALLLAGSRLNWLLPNVALIPFYVRGGAALFLAIGATSPSVGGSVAVAYQAIGRTLSKR